MSKKQKENSLYMIQQALLSILKIVPIVAFLSNVNEKVMSYAMLSWFYCTFS